MDTCLSHAQYLFTPCTTLKVKRAIAFVVTSTQTRCLSAIWGLLSLLWDLVYCIKGEVHSKMLASYFLVFGALSRMLKVRGACGKPFWINKQLNNCAAPAPDSDDVLVVAPLACPAHKNVSSSTTKTSALSGAGGGGGGVAQLFNRVYIQNGFSHAPRTFTVRFSTPNTTSYEVIIFG